MTKRDYKRTVELRCPTCTGTQFEYDEDAEAEHASVRCIGCDRVTSKDELVRENAENINAHASEIGKEAVEDFAKEIRKSLESALRGSKHIKFK